MNNQNQNQQLLNWIKGRFLIRYRIKKADYSRI